MNIVRSEAKAMQHGNIRFTPQQEMLLECARAHIRDGVANYWRVKSKPAPNGKGYLGNARRNRAVFMHRPMTRGKFYAARREMQSASRLLFNMLSTDYPPKIPAPVREEIARLAKQTFRIAEKMKPAPRSTDTIVPREEYL